MSHSAPHLSRTIQYDMITIIFHWMTALLVLFQFTIGISWDLPPKPIHHLMVIAHLTVGVFLTAVMILRIIWRLKRRIMSGDTSTPQKSAPAHYMEYMLYGLIILEVVLGYLWRWGSGKAISFFNYVIPPPFTRFSTVDVTWLHILHNWNAWLIMALIAGHALAALFHQFVLHDKTLNRMLPNR